ncbi:putative cytosolic sulfotransferase 7-like isoform X1 [Capsicum annuum]|nr:putative cytosolic sulfotransferase 7-like isoform X1 [Capsicum annuum]
MPAQVNEAEWKFLVEYFSSDDFKKATDTGKEPNFQEFWEMTHMKSNGHWVNDASAEVNDKVKEVVAEQIQEIEEGTNVDGIINAAVMQTMREKAGYIRGQDSGVKAASRRPRDEIEEQLEAQQKEMEEERHKRGSLESKLMEVKNQLEAEQKNRELMETRLVREQKLLKEGVMALVAHMQSSMNGLSAAFFNIVTDSTSSDGASPTSLMDKNWIQNASGPFDRMIMKQGECDDPLLLSKGCHELVIVSKKGRGALERSKVSKEELGNALVTPTKSLAPAVFLLLGTMAEEGGIPNSIIQATSASIMEKLNAMDSRLGSIEGDVTSSKEYQHSTLSTPQNYRAFSREEDFMEEMKSSMKWPYFLNLYGISEELKGEDIEDEEEYVVRFPMGEEA